MKRYFLIILCILSTCPIFANDGQGAIALEHKGGNHLEQYLPADMPEVYYDSDEMEITIVADGFAGFYNVDIVFVPTSTLVISTQISGYGDSIDISSLPSGYYRIVITSEYNNVYQGYFTIV